MNGTKIVDLNGLDKNYWIKSVIRGKKHMHITVARKTFLTNPQNNIILNIFQRIVLFVCLFVLFWYFKHLWCYYFVLQNTLEGDGKLHILFLFFVALMFFISLWSLFGYHLYLTGSNKTTLGKFYQPAEYCIIYLTCVAVKDWLV